MLFQQFLNVGNQKLRSSGREMDVSATSQDSQADKASHLKKILLIAYALYGEYMLKFCVACILITRLQSEIPCTQSHLFLGQGSVP